MRTVQEGTANTGAAAGPMRDTRVSKSDEQLFGDYAPAVRQLGIAADAANEAHRLLRGIGSELRTSPPGGAEDDPEFTLLGKLTQLRSDAAVMHREVARHAIAKLDASMMSAGAEVLPRQVRKEPLSIEALLREHALAGYHAWNALVVADDLELAACRFLETTAKGSIFEHVPVKVDTGLNSGEWCWAERAAEDGAGLETT